MSLVAQCLRGSGPVPRSKIRFRLKARENKVRRSRGVVRCNCAVRVIKVPGGAVLRGCKKTRRKLLAHFQLRAGIHSQLRVIASLYVLRIFLTCLPASMEMDWAPEAEPEPDPEPEPEPEPEPVPAPPTLRPPSARIAARHPPPAAPTGPPMPLDSEDPVLLQQLKAEQALQQSRWRPLELCYWPDQGALPAKGKEYPGLGYKRLRDKPPKAQQQQAPPI
ncbi:hypothetical protein QJQ45_010733 [Haematococcus lacustris]|nr:hypothetical protein QJQ45_010733 [Haematococcus lacustris]